MIGNDSVNETGRLNESEERVSGSYNVAVLVLQFGHEASDEDNTACDCERKRKDSR